MLSVVRDDLFKVHVEAIVNPTNCVGVMGKGIALAVKKRYPLAFQAYARACKAGKVIPGRMNVVEIARVGDLSSPKFLVNFPTKRHWRDPSHIEDIEAGLVDLVAVVREHRIQSIAVPAIGCGLGGLAWADVRPIIEAKLSPLEDVHVLVLEPT